MITTNLITLYNTNGDIVLQGQMLGIENTSGELSFGLAALGAALVLFFLIFSYRKGKEALDAASE